MSGKGERLKALNMKWLVLLAALDVALILFFVAPELVGGATITQVGFGRIVSTTVLPVVVLLLVNVLPHDIKSMLIYWKPRGVLPGAEAFTKHGPADPRIDMDALRKNIGVLPTEPDDQNATWYRLYKMVSDEPEVREAHKLSLMYRDMAVLSLALMVLVPIALRFVGAADATAGLAVLVFFAQYLLTALSGRWSGVRFVTNVLAIHSARKVGPKKDLA